MLEDARTALGVVEPLARFGPSAFGPVRARAVSADGVPGDWMPLGTLVRLPGFKELHCPHTSAKACILSGTNLFLVESVSGSADFTNPIEVPPDYTSVQLAVPHPTNGTLYLKLRDDPDTVQTLSMPLQFLSSPSAPAAAPAVAPATVTTPAPAASIPADQSAAKPDPKT
jgi:hypothetical protein